MTTTTDRRRGPRGRIRYLCCTCGTQRTASMNYHPTPPSGVEEPQGARWLQWLKCETCDAAGWHAGLSSDHPALTVGGDHEENALTLRTWQSAPRRSRRERVEGQPPAPGFFVARWKNGTGGTALSGGCRGVGTRGHPAPSTVAWVRGH